MKEVKLVFGHEGQTLRWHDTGATGGFIPDSRPLWEYMWEHRPAAKGGTGLFAGFAHTHPWSGAASPSQTDVTTFRALEQGLGGLFWWPVVTLTDVLYYRWDIQNNLYAGTLGLFKLPDASIAELRARSLSS